MRPNCQSKKESALSLSLSLSLSFWRSYYTSYVQTSRSSKGVRDPIHVGSGSRTDTYLAHFVVMHKSLRCYLSCLVSAAVFSPIPSFVPSFLQGSQHHAIRKDGFCNLFTTTTTTSTSTVALNYLNTSFRLGIDDHCLNTESFLPSLLPLMLVSLQLSYRQQCFSFFCLFLLNMRASLPFSFSFGPKLL